MLQAEDVLRLVIAIAPGPKESLASIGGNATGVFAVPSETSLVVPLARPAGTYCAETT